MCAIAAVMTSSTPSLYLQVTSSRLIEGETVHSFDTGGYSLLETSEVCPFTINPSTRELKVSHTIDFSSGNLTSHCTPTPSGDLPTLTTYHCLVLHSDTNQTHLVINVTPNLTQLLFPQSAYSGVVIEGTENALVAVEGLQVLTVPFHGLLLPDFHITGDSSDKFSVSRVSANCETFPVLRTNAVLSRTEQSHHNITLEAFSGDILAATTLNIHVLDINDHPPVLATTDTTVFIEEGSFPGTPLVSLSATDSDLGPNGDILYSLSPLSPYLTIHPFTGSIFPYRTFHHDTEQAASLTLSLQDYGHPTLTTKANLTIFMDDVNTNPPVIHVLSIRSVGEGGSAGGLPVATVAVNDSDSPPSSLSLNILGSTCECFQLSRDTDGAHTYSLTLTTALDYENFPEGYLVILSASDNDSPPLTSVYELRINVTDLNEAPYFAQPEHQTAVPENVPPGTEIIRIMASDLDIGTNAELSYEISNSNGWFEIDSETGVIYTATNITVGSVELTVTATDTGGKHASTTLTVTVEDVNDHRPIWTSSNLTVTIPETQTSMDAIFTFSAMDNDSLCNGGVKYSLLHSEPPVFHIDSLTGALYPLKDDTLDYEAFQSATVVVRAEDQGNRWSYSTYSSLVIQLVDVDDEVPVVDPIGCPCWITENMVEEQCQSLSAHDADTSSLTFHIQSGNEENRFTLDETTGVVRPHSSLDREEQEEYTLMITASDQLRHSEPQPLRIIVVDMNDSPPSYDTSSISVVVPRDLPVGGLVANVAADHPDTGFNGLTKYSLTAGTIGEYFVLDSLSGQIYTLKMLPSGLSLSFTIIAEDLLISSQMDSLDVTITIDGLVDNPPVFAVSSDQILVAANHMIGSVILQLSAVDPDSDPLTYDYTTADGNTLFTVEQSGLNEAQLILNESLLTLAGAEYSLNVSCTDGLHTAYQEVTIIVYANSLSVGGAEFQHNSGVPVCHLVGSIPELSSGGDVALTLPSTINSQNLNYNILDSPSAFSLDGLNLVSEGGFEFEFDRSQREALYISLRAIYGNNLFYLCSVTVLIEDMNNQGPVFLKDQYSIEVYRDTPVDASVFRFQAVDGDVGTNAEVQYIVLTDTTPFGLRDGTSGVLQVTGELSELDYMLTVQAMDAQDSSKTATATLAIVILQSSNTQPLVTTIAPLTLDEATPLGPIGMLQVTDPDSGVHMRTSYCMHSGNNYGLFGVDESGTLLLENPLDSESYPSSYSLEVVVFDSSPNPRYNSATVSITVQERNDETPHFTAPNYTATVGENLDPGTPVVRVTATDRDGDSVEYSILQTNVPFTISERGEISTTSRLNREASAIYDLTVMASDQERSSVTSVTVIVLDENDNEPVWDTPSQNQPLSEGTAVGSILLPTLEATDNDEEANSVLWYSIVSGNDEFVFSLDPWTGAISLSHSLDYESDDRTYSLTFAVHDLGTPSLSASTTVTITYQLTNDNDNYPQFTQPLYTCNITGTTFDFPCQVQATDADMDSVQYSLVSDQFSIDQTGNLSVISGSPTTAPVVVRAVDSGSPPLTSSVLVDITVMDSNNDLPRISPASPIMIPESVPTNSLLFYFHAEDRDSGVYGEVEYFNQLQDDPLFTVNKETGAVFLKGVLDFETSSSHTLTVLASNLDDASLPPTTYTVQVMDVDENTLPPLFSVHNPSAITVYQGTPPGTIVATLEALDSDPGIDGEVSYSTTGGSAVGYFLIDSSTGNISLSRDLSAVSDDRLSLTVTAIDGGSFPLSSTISLPVFLQPDPESKPFFLAPEFHASVPERQDNVIISHVVALSSGRADPDTRYSITGGNEGAEFAVDSCTGAVSVLSGMPLDYRRQSLYSLIIEASKLGVDLNSTALLAVQVENVDDGRPEYPSGYDYTIKVFESFPLSQEVMRVFLVDEDHELDYSIISPDDQLPFNISSITGELYLTESLEGQVGSNYTFSVEAADSDGLDRTAEVTVMVAAPSGLQPFFSQSASIDTIQLSEDTAPGEGVVYTVQPMTVAGGSALLMYWIADAPPQFAIHPNTGEVFLTQPLDREDVPGLIHTLDIAVWDGTESDPALFLLNVQVTDVNDHRPVLTTDHFSFTVEEHSSPGQTVGTITATDKDDISTVNAQLSFSLVDAEYHSTLELFQMEPNGTLLVLGDLDREELPKHTLTVAVMDGGSPRLVAYGRITVTVTDINDHSPVFQTSYTHISVPEDTVVGATVFTALAFDPDIGNNAHIAYSLQPTGTAFTLEASTGTLLVSQPLDAETVTSYTLTITAYHPVDVSQSSSLQLNVSVLDVLDSPPSLSLPSNPVSLSENLPPFTPVTTLTAQSNVRPVYYSIVAGNEQQHFFIEPLTGTVRTSTVLDRETVPSYDLTLSGAYGPEYESNVTLQVLVLDQNDSPPLFPSPILLFTLSSVDPSPLPLGITDFDEPANGQVDTYLIPDTRAAHYFTVSSSGSLILRSLATELSFPAITFDVYAIGSGSPQLFSQATVFITISTPDGNPPVFSLPEYQVTISTPVTLGAPLFTVTASGDGELTYSIVGGNGTERFQITPLFGTLAITNNFHLESLYTLEVAATDGAGRVGQSVVTVSLRECGYQGLAFVSRTVAVEVSEDVPDGTVVYRPNIIDRESDTVLEFIFSLPTPASFSLDPATGFIAIMGSLDREDTPLHQLVLQARDSATPDRIAQVDIELIVTDINDNSPVFVGTPYSASVSKTAEVGEHVLTLSAEDPDQGNTVTYAIPPSQFSALFDIDPVSGLITVGASLLVTELGSTITLTVLANDNGSPPLYSQTQVSVSFVDPNAPIFTQNVYRTNISESARPGALVFTVQAMVASGTSGQITYRFQEGEGIPPLPFYLDALTGEVTVNDRELDYESETFYQISLEAEHLSSELTGQARLDVTVLDENDISPAFTQFSYFRSISENTQPGATVLTVTAVDGDSAPNSQVRYELVGVEGGVFLLDDDTGVITTARSVDYEETTRFEFTVHALDSGVPQRTGSTTVTVSVENENDNPPAFDQSVYIVGVSADEAIPGSPLLFVNAEDEDEDTIEYGIVSGSDNFEMSLNGILSLSASVLLIEFKYLINISAWDGMFYDFATVEVEVDHGNEYNPVFNQSIYHASVVEDSPAGVFVAQVFASDEDQGFNGEITYTRSNLQEEVFSMDPATGTITTAGGQIDREETPVINMVVTARDGGGRSGTANVEITVVDINDNAPAFTQQQYVTNIIESASNGDLVLTVEAVDPDAGANATVQYSLNNTEDDQFPFVINHNNGMITLVLLIDHERVPEYTFSVTANDMGDPPLTSEVVMVTVHVVDTDDTPPVFEEESYSFFVPEQTLPFTVFAMVQTTGEATCDLLVYSSIEPDIPFNVISHSGELEMDDFLRREDGDMYDFHVLAECYIGDSTLTNFAPVTVHILDINERPSFDSVMFSMSIAENLPPSPVGEIQAIDNDLGENMTVTMELIFLNGSLLTGVPFVIVSVEGNPLAGQLHTTGPLDRETVSEYSFFVRAVDHGSPPLTSSSFLNVRIEVSDVNDSPPRFSQDEYYLELREDILPGTVIFCTAEFVSDPDEIGEFTYTAAGGPFLAEQQTGEVNTTEVLDYESTPYYQLFITVNDGITTEFARIHINVTDANDNRPVFEQTEYSITVRENASVNTVFLQVVATDADEGENAIITYSFVNNDGDFAINSSSGEISFAKAPDFESSEQLEALVRASDGSPDTSDQQLTKVVVFLVDINDNSPVFTQDGYNFTVNENFPIGTTIGILAATDEDEGVNGFVTYSISGPNASSFHINQQNGNVQTLRVFDRESESSFELVVTASDSGNVSLSSSATVRVSVEDENDNAPTFSQESYTVNVSEELPPGEILKVKAEDRDVGDNGDITYSFIGSGDTENVNDVFSLSETPEKAASLSIKEQLNHENIQSYSLILFAEDKGLPTRQTGSASILVVVIDENDNSPIFTETQYIESVMEDESVGTTIITVHATDLDTTDTQLTYSIQDSHSYPELLMNATSGSILIAQPLDYETRPSYTLTVVASDRLEDPRTGTATVNIEVQDVNDNPPYFTNLQEPRFTIVENGSPRDLITLEVDDRDNEETSVPALVTFSILSGNEHGNFALGSASGILSVLRGLDREEVEQYCLVVGAEDHGTPSLTGNATITIAVGDLNDNPPQTETQTIYIFLHQGQLSSSLLGTVFVQDPDITNDHHFAISSQDTTGIFDIDQEGRITISEDPPPDTYSLSVTVTDTGYPDPATTTVRVHVGDVSMETTANSFVMQLAGVTPDGFVVENLQHFTSIIELLIVNATALSEVNLQVFAIQPSRDGENVDVLLAAQMMDQGYVPPTLVQHLIHLDRSALEQSLDVEVVTELMDHCSEEICASGEECTVSASYQPAIEPLGSASSVTHLGLHTSFDTTCGALASPCPALTCPEPSYCVEDNGLATCLDDCSTNPCKNNGQCVPQSPGYYCSCPEGFDGRNCELSTATFEGTSYAVFPSLTQRSQGTISLEMITNEGETHGLLLYSGRFDSEAGDYLALVLAEGHPTLHVSYGGERTTVSLDETANDQLWHSISVEYNSSVSGWPLSSSVHAALAVRALFSIVYFSLVLSS